MTSFLSRYVTTSIYLASVAVVMLAVSGRIAVVVGLVTVAVLVLVATLLAEVHTVHVLVNGNHDALIAEVRRLQALLDKERREP